MRGVERSALIACVVLALGASPVAAQVWVSGGSAGPRLGSVELSGGALLAQGYDLGDASATLTRNPTTGTGPFLLFTTDTRLDRAIGGQARLAVYLARAFSIEGGAQYAKPTLRSRASNDSEGADPVTATSTLTRYVFDGSLVMHLLPLSFAGGRAVPFVLGGAGYVRELHQGNELVETGQEIHAGGGVKFWIGRGARRLGVRAEGGVSLRDGGFDFNDDRRMLPTAGISLMYLF